MFVILGGKISVFDWKEKIIGFFHIDLVYRSVLAKLGVLFVSLFVIICRVLGTARQKEIVL